MKAKLTFVKNEQKTSKAGKPYTACAIKTEATGNEYLNGFGNKVTATWLEGDEVDIEIYEEEYNGKMYKHFRMLNETDLLKETVTKLIAVVKKHEERIKALENKGLPHNVVFNTTPAPTFKVSHGDITPRSGDITVEDLNVLGI